MFYYSVTSRHFLISQDSSWGERLSLVRGQSLKSKDYDMNKSVCYYMLCSIFCIREGPKPVPIYCYRKFMF